MTKLDELLDALQVSLCEEMKLQLQKHKGELDARVMKEIREYLKQNGIQFGKNDAPLNNLTKELPFGDDGDNPNTAISFPPPQKMSNG